MVRLVVNMLHLLFFNCFSLFNCLIYIKELFILLHENKQLSIFLLTVWI